MAPYKNSSLTTINLMNHSPKKAWTHSAAHRALNILLTAAITMSLHSQAFAQKVSMIPKKAQAAASKNKKRRASIDQQILAQAQALQSTKIYSDDVYKKKAKSKPRNSVAQTGAMTSGLSNTLDVDKSQYESSNKLSTKLNEAKKEEAPTNKVNGSVSVTVGQDSNIDVDRSKAFKGGFYEMQPSISYEGSTFSGAFGARIKDFSKQENSAVAKETDINLTTAAKFSLSENMSTTSKLDFLNSETRWPDFLGGSDEGMPIRYFETKFTQSLNFKLNSVTIGVNGSYSNRDFSNEYRDTSDILGNLNYQRDLNDAKLDAKIETKFNDNFALAFKPLIKHRKFKTERARQTEGVKGAGAFADTTPVREILTNEISVDLSATLGAFSITPTARVGQDVDRALGAEDTSFSGGGLSLGVVIDKDLGLKLGASANKTFVKYDNWTDKVVPAGERRESEWLNTGLTASVNLSKAVSLGLEYAREEAESNAPTLSDENYHREIIGSTISVSF